MSLQFNIKHTKRQGYNSGFCHLSHLENRWKMSLENLILFFLVLLGGKLYTWLISENILRVSSILLSSCSNYYELLSVFLFIFLLFSLLNHSIPMGHFFHSYHHLVW